MPPQFQIARPGMLSPDPAPEYSDGGRSFPILPGTGRLGDPLIYRGAAHCAHRTTHSGTASAGCTGRVQIAPPGGAQWRCVAWWGIIIISENRPTHWRVPNCVLTLAAELSITAWYDLMKQTVHLNKPFLSPRDCWKSAMSCTWLQGRPPRGPTSAACLFRG